VAAQIHDEVGGDQEALNDTAARIEAARHRTAAALRAAGFGARLATALLTPLPLAVAVIRAAVDPAYLERLTGTVLGWVSLTVMAALMAAGALWLRRVAQPPFTALPGGWRAYQERIAGEEAIADALDRASLYATAGLDLDTAIERAVRVTPQPADGLWDTLRLIPSPAPVSVPDAPDDALVQERTPDWLAAAHRWSSKGLAAPDVLAAARARLHANVVWEADQLARRIPTSALLPLLICIAPAMALAGLGGGL
jgi:hypothetical protein